MSTETKAIRSAPIKTAKVSGRRKLQYARFADLLRDAETLAAGPVRTLGNWSFGQIMAHLANTMDMSINGAHFQVPWAIRFFAKFFKKRMLMKPMTPGFRLPRRAAEQLIPVERVSTEAGLERLRQAIQRQQTVERRAPSPLFGPLTLIEWNLLHLRHAELHMSFVAPA